MLLTFTRELSTSQILFLEIDLYVIFPLDLLFFSCSLTLHLLFEISSLPDHECLFRVKHALLIIPLFIPFTHFIFFSCNLSQLLVYFLIRQHSLISEERLDTIYPFCTSLQDHPNYAFSTERSTVLPDKHLHPMSLCFDSHEQNFVQGKMRSLSFFIVVHKARKMQYQRV